MFSCFLSPSLSLSQSDSLAGVGLRYERVVVGILRVPALAGDSRGRDVGCAPVAFAAALVALSCFRHAALRGRLCGRAVRMRRGGRQAEGKKRRSERQTESLFVYGLDIFATSEDSSGFTGPFQTAVTCRTPDVDCC